MSTIKRLLLISGWVLTPGILALGVIQSGDPAHLVDRSGFLFVLVGGMALALISFPGAEIRRALRDAVGTPAKEADYRGLVMPCMATKIGPFSPVGSSIVK